MVPGNAAMCGGDAGHHLSQVEAEDPQGQVEAEVQWREGQVEARWRPGETVNYAKTVCIKVPGVLQDTPQLSMSPVVLR